ncbi:Ig-like domain repeat protein [Streptomyces polygonati]|uniref:Ig-like domain repeat protein n=1 Tax=Streptomyces polygonati TaxID=1617087 RepID=A0ABV8I1H8_9ACTN
MRKMRLASAVVVAAIAVSGTVLATPAMADPPAGTFRPLVGVGSDTTQDVLNALAGDTVNGISYAATAVTADGKGIASYDAIQPGTGSTTSSITTRSGGPAFQRPNGSGPGRTALSTSLDGNAFGTGAGATPNPGQVDFARSSGGPSVSGTALTYIPLARDAVGVAAKGTLLQNLSVVELHDIYSSTAPEVNGTPVHPFLPQVGSGTRKFFLGAIGLTDADIHNNVGIVQENQANPALTLDNSLVPFSVGSWIAQNNGISPDFSTTAVSNGAYLANIQLPGDTGTTSPVVTVNGKLAPVSGYFENSTFGRDVYDVVPSRSIDQTSVFFDKAIYDVFVTNGSHVAAMASADAQSVIAKFGFLNESYDGSIDPSHHMKLGGLEDSSASSALPGTPVLHAAPDSGSVDFTWAAPALSGLPVTDYRLVIKNSKGTVLVSKDLTAGTKSYNFANQALGSYSATVTANSLNGAGKPASWSGAVKYVSITSGTAATTAFGGTPHVSATVRNNHAVVTTGTVTVKEGTAVRGTGTLNSKGQVSVALPKTLAVGTHTLTVAYNGNPSLLSSSATVKLTIAKANPVVTVSAPKSISHLSQAKVTVKVAAAGTVPTGTVRIYSGSTVMATGTLKNGQVVITMPKLSKGNRVLRALYVGSTSVAGEYSANFTVKSV